MNDWLDANADALALMVCSFLWLLGACAVTGIVIGVHRLVRWVDHNRPRPRAERGAFRQVALHARGRRAMATDLQPRYALVSGLDHDALKRKAGEP